METELFWAGEFGDDYGKRNVIDPASRLDFWRSAMEFCQPQTVLEVGANRGHNLIAIQTVSPGTDVCGIDINASAANEARSNGISVDVGSALELASRYGHDSKDLVFSAGCLIHIPPAELQRVMQQIVDVSARFIIAVEYEAEKEEAVTYRGHEGKLWRRNYGELYQALGCELLAVVPDAGGFDNCTAWVLSKPGAREIEELF